MKKYQGILGVFFAVAVSILIFVFRNNISGLQAYGYFGLFIFNMLGSATLFLPAPLFLTAFTAAAIYHPVLVAVVASAGSAIGEITGYIAGYGAKELLDKNIKIQRTKKWMDKYGLWALFVFAAVPNPLFDAAGIIAGATKLPVYKYLLVVWAGKFVKFSAIAYLGAQSLKVFGVHTGF